MLNQLSWQDERGVVDGRAVHEPHERRSRAKSFSTSPVASATPPEVLSWPPSQPTLDELRHIYIFARECLPKHPRCMKKKINGWCRRWYMWVLLAGNNSTGAVVCVCSLGGKAIATHHGVTLMDSLSARIWGENAAQIEVPRDFWLKSHLKWWAVIRQSVARSANNFFIYVGRQRDDMMLCRWFLHFFLFSMKELQ